MYSEYFNFMQSNQHEYTKDLTNGDNQGHCMIYDEKKKEWKVKFSISGLIS